MRASLWTSALPLVFIAACESKNPYASSGQPTQEPASKTEGVHPDLFDCNAFLPASELAALAGGEVELVDNAAQFFNPAPGTPRPCSWILKSDETRAWQVAFDCRDMGHSDAEKHIKTIAGRPDFRELFGIGRRAVDHSNAQVIAIDDDTPCAVRVVGPDEMSRANLARLVVQRLSTENQPRKPVRGIK